MGRRVRAVLVFDAYGTAWAEAMAVGLPVVGWRAGNLPRLAEHGREALMAEPGDLAGLASYANNKRIVFEGDNYAEEWHLKRPLAAGCANKTAPRRRPYRLISPEGDRGRAFGAYDVLSERELPLALRRDRPSSTSIRAQHRGRDRRGDRPHR